VAIRGSWVATIAATPRSCTSRAMSDIIADRVRRQPPRP
jgi:hypothetical protein